MRVLCACAVAAVAAAQPAEAPPPAPEDRSQEQDGKDALEDRVRALEAEVARLKLRQEGEEDGPPAPPPAPAPAPNVFNPTITAFGNGVGRWDDRPVLTEGGGRVDRRFWLREVEMDLRAAVDPFADALAIVSLEAESPAAYEATVEEGYVTIKSLPLPLMERPPLGLKIRVGRFYTDTGRVNRLHTHDLPWPYRPLPAREFLGEEAFSGDGASAQVFLPIFPFDDESAVELVAQAVTGGASRMTEQGVNSPGVVGNLRWFRTFAGAHSFDLAGVFHEGATRDDNTARAYLVSGDGLYRWKPLRGGEFRSFVLGGQYFWLRPTDTDARPRGWFAFAQFQPWRPLYVGGRWDMTNTLDASAQRRAATGYVSWYTSEFLRLRAGYERRWSDRQDEDGRDSVIFEINFVFGAHPPEPFWVNK